MFKNNLIKFRSFPVDREMYMMDCGPSCLKMIAKYYGKFYSLQYLRDKCGITKEGVSFLDLNHRCQKKLVIADIGYFETEQFTSDLLEIKFGDLSIHLSKQNTNPVNYLY